MARLVVAIALAAIFAAIAGAEVISLNDATFTDKVKEQDTVWFIKFFAPWCGHCKRLAPTWDELGKAIESEAGVEVARVDCTVDRAVCEKAGVNAYPTLKIFYNGEEVKKYSGARDLDSLKKFAIDSAAEISKAKLENDSL
ncbi:hypothetical protein SELMODRAFT_99470 [Selaginella moellendorffii]|uniref:Thioredoxin domain-containing protein n=1 Tax=Selaginella moellendorffii TaxID=88036 RepID=D8RRA3_SELML|nr:protein disulfide isomerase-like 5-1 [Selaginella moellendorffii]XP_002975576.1 protein disulfide isomerase-like 5-1 [Selaginella moellendorffii]EFJ23205.1 hypothetical protein SELMODRAFT_175060 [Selaginella moellendorffii]EFJ25208.1 hypothetical protein SELMODRAFT_99470 [Selaginella moellendorffii]|eukprot:XP_002973548.1 protein disulfide isomerase-like 5-1 [Selaginella moellendorffii]